MYWQSIVAVKERERLFKNALWLDQMYWYYDLKSIFFTRDYHSMRKRKRLGNPYLEQIEEDVVPEKPH